uniref:Uncharacterized protein n=1 Tax=Physcomitrium patens TaxID=3218 RepID=A0A2K1INK9_PHYPA|nr:hypothetical protein PHYPA_027185 [Physcomitrium patens]
MFLNTLYLILDNKSTFKVIGDAFKYFEIFEIRFYTCNFLF